MKSNSLYLTLIGGSREVVFTFSVSSDGGGAEERSLVSQPYWQLCVVGLALLISKDVTRKSGAEKCALKTEYAIH